MTSDSKLVLGMLLFVALAFAGCAEEKASIDASVSPVDSGVRASDASSRSDAAQALPPIQPYVTAAGIGVTDLDTSAAFYTEVLGLTFKYDLSTPSWNEKILEDVRGNSVVLMDFTRERNTKHNPVKLVFAVPDVQVAYDAVLAGGGSSASAPMMLEGTKIALAFDPDEYLIELIQIPTVPSNVLVGVGIGVSDLDQSADFYTRVLGMRFERDIPVPGFMDEKELRSYQMKGLSIVLMHYEDETREYKDIPAKIVFGVRDAAGFARLISDEDATKLLAAPMPYGTSGLIVGMAKDLEGYLVEILQSAGSDAGSGTGPTSGVDAGMDKDAGAAKDAGPSKDGGAAKDAAR